jgi:hypothetical protein
LKQFNEQQQRDVLPINFKDNLRDDECKHRELFNNLIFSYYLNQMYGNILPKVYGVVIVNNNAFVEQEIYIISEKMHQTAEDWFVSMIYLNECIHKNPIPESLVEEFKQIIYQKDKDNHLVYQQNKNPGDKLFLRFYDCKLDNIMIDQTGIWKIIDIDGVNAYDYSSLDVSDVNFLVCGLNFQNALFDPSLRIYHKLIESNLEKIKDYNRRFKTLPRIDDLKLYLE